MKVLVTRTDKLGDLVLSLPVFEYLKRVWPELEISALVAPVSVPLVENNPHLQGVWTWSDLQTPEKDQELQQQLKVEGFDAVIMLQYRRELALLLKGAGIGRRYGPWSRWSSWFLLNRGSWQARAHSSLHEMDQNLNLARRFLGLRAQGIEAPAGGLFLTQGQREMGQEFRAQAVDKDESLIFVHPGSGGSALDWQPARYAGVANTLNQLPGFRVFITGSAVDREKVEAVQSGLDPGVGVLLGQYKLREFLGILSAGDFFIGPSTGPLHLAATLGLGTVGLFPPVSTMGPGRWGPRGPWTAAVVPQVKCPARRLCKMERCAHFNCLDEIFERDVLGAVMELHRQKIEAEVANPRPEEERS